MRKSYVLHEEHTNKLMNVSIKKIKNFHFGVIFLLDKLNIKKISKLLYLQCDSGQEIRKLEELRGVLKSGFSWNSVPVIA
jgi:hypothetical protein